MLFTTVLRGSLRLSRYLLYPAPVLMVHSRASHSSAARLGSFLRFGKPIFFAISASLENCYFLHEGHDRNTLSFRNRKVPQIAVPTWRCRGTSCTIHICSVSLCDRCRVCPKLLVRSRSLCDPYDFVARAQFRNRYVVNEVVSVHHFETRSNFCQFITHGWRFDHDNLGDYWCLIRSERIMCECFQVAVSRYCRYSIHTFTLANGESRSQLTRRRQ